MVNAQHSELCRVAMSTLLLVWGSHLQQDLDAILLQVVTQVMGSMGTADCFLSQWIEVPTQQRPKHAAFGFPSAVQAMSGQS